MFRRARHQRGSLKRIRRKSGQIVWVFRWYETQFDGRKKYRKVVIGSGEDFETEAAAQQAADALRLTINQLTPRQLLHAISFETLVQHYRQHEMPDIFYKDRKAMLRVLEEEGKKSYATQETYEGYLNKWILPRWRSSRLGDVKAVRVEEWLHTLPLARGSKAKIRNIMSALYSHAIRWEFASRNPITAVRQSAKRSKIPTILTVQEIQALLKHLEDPCRIMVLLGVSTGLRVGELLGLKWIEVDFEKLQINITRSVVKQKIGPCKTEASHKPIPLDSELVEQLRRWRHKTSYSRPNDWMFASPHKRGYPTLLAGIALPSTSPACQLQGDRGYLHPSNDPGETAGSNQNRPVDSPPQDHCGGKQAIRNSHSGGLSNPFKPSVEGACLSKAFGMLASPAGFEPALPP